MAQARREGVEAVSLTALARRAGVTGTAPFRHFESREALLLAVAEDAARRLAGRLEAATAGVVDPVEAQRRVAVASVRFAVEEPGAFRILTRPQSLASPLIAALDRGAREAMEAVFATGGAVTARVVRRSAGHLAAQALVYGLQRMLVEGHLGEVDADTAARLTEEVTEVLGRGLRGDRQEGAGGGAGATEGEGVGERSVARRAARKNEGE